jgi:hypothetical protein
MTKFRVGDLVEVVNYGHPYWQSLGGELVAVDTCPELIGQQGIITKAITTQEIEQYSIDGIKHKTAWYQNGQLKLIIRPNYKKNGV